MSLFQLFIYPLRILLHCGDMFVTQHPRTAFNRLSIAQSDSGRERVSRNVVGEDFGNVAINGYDLVISFC